MPGLADVFVADLSSAGQVRRLADAANALVNTFANAFGAFDAVIYNAGVGFREPQRVETEDGHAHVLAINVLAPYLLTAWMHRPGRIVYLTSGMQQGGGTDLSDPDWRRRSWNGVQAYSDSKLFDATLAAAVARRWPEVVSTSASPGWAPTKMGGDGAPDDLDAASLTQTWLAVFDDEAALQSGAMFYHQEQILSPQDGGAKSLHPSLRAGRGLPGRPARRSRQAHRRRVAGGRPSSPRHWLTSPCPRPTTVAVPHSSVRRYICDREPKRLSAAHRRTECGTPEPTADLERRSYLACSRVRAIVAPVSDVVRASANSTILY